MVRCDIIIYTYKVHKVHRRNYIVYMSTEFTRDLFVLICDSFSSIFSRIHLYERFNIMNYSFCLLKFERVFNTTCTRLNKSSVLKNLSGGDFCIWIGLRSRVKIKRNRRKLCSRVKMYLL